MTAADQQNGLATRILEYMQQRRDEKLEKEKNADKRLEITAKYEPETWLSDAARRASRTTESKLTRATHAPKYIHPDSKGSSVAVESTDISADNSYISTNSVSEIQYDVVGNAADLDIWKFLLLEHEGQRLIDTLQRGDNTPILAIAPDADMAQEWTDGFLSVLASPEPMAHKFSKQCYWPVNSDGYHILIPLYATSLAHTLHSIIQHVRFSDEAKATREARRKEEYSNQEDIRYPDLAVQSFGGTNRQNISQLNSQRGGKAYLFSCKPPSWQWKPTTPLNTYSIFSQRFERRLYREHIQPLRDFLQRVADKPNNDRIKKQRARRLDEIVSEILNLAAEVQQLPPGWSANSDCKLPLVEVYWLDPGRSEIDEEFRSQRDATDWQAEVAQSFAIWLSRKLESDTLAFGAVEQRELRDLLEPELRGL